MAGIWFMREGNGEGLSVIQHILGEIDAKWKCAGESTNVSMIIL